MKHLLSLIVAVISVIPPAGYGQVNKSIINFYPIADSICTYPPLDTKLTIICQKKYPQYITKESNGKLIKDTSNLYITFIGYKKHKQAIIAAVTNQKIKDANQEIYRMVDFDRVVPKIGKVTTWGYIFDRNHDGKIDYFSLVDGAAPFLDDKIPESYPARGQKLSRPDLELFISHCKIIFNHWADDNYDGKIDAVIHVDIDDLRDWVKRHIVARCTKYDENFDDVWAFKKSIKDNHENVSYTNNSVSYRPLGKITGKITNETMKEKTNILRLINNAAADCNLGKGSFQEK